MAQLRDRKEEKKTYRQTHTDAITSHYSNNKDDTILRQTQYREDNKDKTAERAKIYRETHKAERGEKKRSYRELNS